MPAGTRQHESHEADEEGETVMHEAIATAWTYAVIALLAAVAIWRMTA